MNLSLISCGVFRYELEKVLPEIEAELDCKIGADFLAPCNAPSCFFVSNVLRFLYIPNRRTIMPEMTAAEAAEWGKSLSFEKVWAALMETDRRFETMRAEAAERSKETDRQIKKTERLVKELSKNIGGVNRSLGKSTEYMFNAKMWVKFNELKYEFTKGAPNVKFLEGNRVIAEVDMFMENGEYVMPAEIKTDLMTEDVDEHLERIKKIRLYMDRHSDKRTIVGAVAGAIVPDNVRVYAQKKGLYVMVPSGKAVAVADMPPGFTPAKW